MLWFFFASLSAALTSAAALIEKKVLFKEHSIGFAALLAFINLAITLPLFPFLDYSKIDFSALPIIFAVAVLGAVAFLFVTKAMRHMEVSSVSPLRLFSPAVVAVLAFLFLGETLTVVQASGIAFLIAGLYILENRGGQFGDVSESGNRLGYIHFVFLAVLLYGITSVGDRYVLTRYTFPPLAYIAFAHLFLAVVFACMLFTSHDGLSRVTHSLRVSGGWILLVALLTVGYRLAHIVAVNIAHVGLVEAIKQTSVFFTVLLGGELFHEKNIARKLAASAIMIFGVVLIVL